MNTEFWPLVGLGAFDLVLLVVCYLGLRAYRPIDRRGVLPVALGLSGFVFHAFMFFQGAFLVLQLATIIGILGLYLRATHKPRKL
jgi:hypothetical protein